MKPSGLGVRDIDTLFGVVRVLLKFFFLANRVGVKMMIALFQDFLNVLGWSSSISAHSSIIEVIGSPLRSQS